MYFDILRNIINQYYKVCMVDFKHIVLYGAKIVMQLGGAFIL
jgi:hypothetical protein